MSGAPAALDPVALATQGGDSVALGPGTSPELLVVASHAGGGDDDPLEALEALLTRLRGAASREAVRALGRDQGYRLEDARALVIAVPPRWEASPLTRWLARRLPRALAPEVVVREGPLSLAAALASRVGGAPDWSRYGRDARGRVRVEAFELHVAEHCNLRCANCCNMSPLVGRRFLSVTEISTLAGRMAGVLSAEVVKIMGGEPLLHPELPAVIRALGAAGVGERVRLFTNGLLLPSMGEDFWEALDELTISSYASAPVKPWILDLAKERARRHGFVLNVKPVVEFSQVLSPRFERDEAVTRRTFERCWLRHRCLIVRNGRFFMCTRAAYAGDFLARVDHEPVPEGFVLDRAGDGVPLDASEGPPPALTDAALADRLEAYLNRAEPLGACRYCFGGDGATEPHHQLTRADVTAGRLSRGLARGG